ncbi:peroxidase 21-like [Malania oleifera]|uniref:peroxidase 21-like n=1 Tax=Malania oleifera TaxID=397392 RepID=UPI0025AE3318|nr:peroxidase 21-like [Malania oleifera]
MAINFFVFLLFPLLLMFHSGESELQLNYYSSSCPRAEEIVKEEVTKLFQRRDNTAISWLRFLFHDCMVKSCDASFLLTKGEGMEPEKESPRSFGIRDFRFLNQIKEAVEKECPSTVSCADTLALSAREAIVLLGGTRIDMRLGRRDTLQNHAKEIEDYIPNHNDSLTLVLSRFQSIGIDAERTVALLGAHSVGRVHCVNLVHRLYPTVDPTLDPEHAEYLKRRCRDPSPGRKAVQYARNDLETPFVIDNNYHKNLLKQKGLLVIDQQLASDPTTLPFVEKMASNDSYFHEQFARAILLLSENNPLPSDQGEIRKDCRYVNNE